MTTPTWMLSIAYWFHMLATVIWIGGLAALKLLALPAARKTLGAPAYAELLQRREIRLLQINLILGVLVLLLTAVARSS